ncbi:hypothetical protein MF271_00920 (plasmid) [Deinococcus sp. KNUC1210]|uniref:hypothetical protein n=1 Tax=Deinococcus sp. KNUC1210 TaxID=2917691 RepID=UPI001EEFEAA5|nr:hypothetical protein [Deinococcus sp. KNUC1210]ULH13924.1 hypothetical protein MF271_00920 [Deinococcus sp. KNUC1210]
MTLTSATVAQDRVQPYETIVSLATRLLGDPMRWQELAQLNGLCAPYVAPQGGVSVLIPGDVILYPISAAAAPAIDSSSLEAMTFQRDLVTRKGDLVLTEEGLPTFQSGLKNFESALLKRILTVIGTHPFHAQFGSLLCLQVGETGDYTRLKIIAQDITTAVLSDPRAASASTELEFRNGTVWAVVTVVAVRSGTVISLDLPLQ